MLRLVDFNYGLFSCQFDMVIKHFPNATLYVSVFLEC